MIACIVAGLIIGYVHFSKKDDSMFSEKSISIPEENSSSLVQVDNMTKDGYRLWKHQDGRSIEAKFIKFENDFIKIKRRDEYVFSFDPSELSEIDKNHLALLKKQSDSTGQVWHKGNYQQELIHQKWFDLPPETPTCKYFDFTNESIDLDKDGRMDGFKVRNFYRINKEFIKPKAWEMDENGVLILKSFISPKIFTGEYKYDFSKESFIKFKGHGPKRFIRSGR